MLLDHFIHSFVLLTVQIGHVLRKIIQFLLEVLPVFLLIVAILFSVEQLLHVDSKREILAELRQPLIQIVELLLAELIVDDRLVPLTGRLEFLNELIAIINACQESLEHDAVLRAYDR